MWTVKEHTLGDEQEPTGFWYVLDEEGEEIAHLDEDEARAMVKEHNNKE